MRCKGVPSPRAIGGFCRHFEACDRERGSEALPARPRARTRVPRVPRLVRPAYRLRRSGSGADGLDLCFEVVVRLLESAALLPVRFGRCIRSRAGAHRGVPLRLHRRRRNRCRVVVSRTLAGRPPTPRPWTPAVQARLVRDGRRLRGAARRLVAVSVLAHREVVGDPSTPARAVAGLARLRRFEPRWVL